MMKTVCTTVAMLVAASLSLTAQGSRAMPVGEWPELRGPNRDGVSQETGLLDRWTLNGENFLWRVPHGGRSAPIVWGDRVYVQNPGGRGADLRERVMALEADTGRTIWEHTFNIYQSDAPPHRIGWASPAVDPETGNVYAFSAGAEVIALNPAGERLWDRSFGEEWSAFTTHGGRTMSPLIDGDLVIVNAAVSNWGEHEQRRHRFIALDKRTGETVYVSTPGGRPYDTAYSPPLIATIGGQRLLIAPLGDGGVHAIRPQTGERVWSFVAAKRGLNTGAVVVGDRVIISHGDENLHTVQMGMIAALDGTATGTIEQPIWANTGTQFGFSSPVTDGTRVYQAANSGVLHAYDLATGQPLWSQRLGASQRANLVLADGKLYVGTENGQFFIIRPYADRAEILSEVVLPDSTDSCCGSEGTPEQIVAGAAVSRGRVFFVSSDAVYAIGSRQAVPQTGTAAPAPVLAGSGAPAHVQVSPTELVVAPGARVSLTARLFDAQGGFLRETPATWTLDALEGTVADGVLTVDSAPREQAGLVKATVEGLTGEARVRVYRPLPWDETFDAYEDGAAPPGWVSLVGAAMSVTTLDGQKVLQKAPLNTLFKRSRVFFGPTHWSNYTFEADVRAPERRRQMADVGITAQRYSLVLYGTNQRLKIESWEPETTRTVTIPFAWAADTWYRVKLRVEPAENGAIRARGKAWPVGDPEPAEWMIEQLDPNGHQQGAPGLFIDAEHGAFLDNFRITANQ
jgi:outer membrane protein assembly factor BamB